MVLLVVAFELFLLGRPTVIEERRVQTANAQGIPVLGVHRQISIAPDQSYLHMVATHQLVCVCVCVYTRVCVPAPGYMK